MSEAESKIRSFTSLINTKLEHLHTQIREAYPQPQQDGSSQTKAPTRSQPNGAKGVDEGMVTVPLLDDISLAPTPASPSSHLTPTPSTSNVYEEMDEYHSHLFTQITNGVRNLRQAYISSKAGQTLHILRFHRLKVIDSTRSLLFL